MRGKGNPSACARGASPSPSNSPIPSPARFILEDETTRGRRRFPLADRPPEGIFLEHFNFEKVGCPRRIEPVSLCPLRLLPGMGGRSPARRGAGGERGKSRPLIGWGAARALRKKRGFSLCLGADVCSRSRQSVSFFKGNTLPPAPPYSPFAITRRVSFLLDCTPSAACRMGHRRGPSPACGRGDVRACCGAPSALRASGIAFAPAPSLHQR